MAQAGPGPFVVVAVAVCAGCGGGGGGSGGAGGGPGTVAPSHWVAVRAAAAPQVVLTSAFAAAAILPIATDGWEDGICVSRDGLHLYATYAPADLLSFVTTGGGDMAVAQDYARGPRLGMDLATNPLALPFWLQADIIHAERPSLAADFGPWRLSAMAKPVTSEGGPQPADGSDGRHGLFVTTTNEVGPDYTLDIVLRRDVATDPSGAGTILPAPVNSAADEDNPHIERLSAGGLVLFFDSANRPGGLGLHDIWYATSVDDGATWSAPAVVSSVSTAAWKEHQPHPWRDGDGRWWLYFTSTAGGKDEIWRALQATPGDWDSWGAPELVVGAGNCAGVGEPTLTSAGDLFFVVVYRDDAHGTGTDRYDADAWWAPRVPAGIAIR